MEKVYKEFSMFFSFEYFLVVWLSSSKKVQSWLVVCWLYGRYQEEDAYESFLRRPLQEIERILRVYVLDVEFRQLFSVAGLGIDEESRSRKGFPLFYIRINQDLDPDTQLEGLLHEILHIACLEYGAVSPDEARLTQTVQRILNRKNRIKIQKIFSHSIQTD